MLVSAETDGWMKDKVMVDEGKKDTDGRSMRENK